DAANCGNPIQKAQRDALVRKGEQGGAEPDLLILTATPIPRTLAMTMYGDLEISTLLHRLPGRTGVQTIHLTESQRKQMMPLVRGALARGERIYIVYPIIEEEDEDEENDERPTLKNAKSQHKKIREAFPDANAALLTGQTKSDQKESTMRDFRDGKISILVATSVVEVGIDVPEATLMVIEHAEHFGLAQLHQLRGRVGRGGRPGTCVLTTADNLAEYAAQRIEALLTTQDGFRIAEEDLELRGPGEMLGERQHGGTELRVAQLLTDKDLIPGASDEAQRIMDADPALEAHPFIRGYKESLEAVGADLL
ncbi:MAG: helicase-related protein, partial [Candidatus Hydrogenedentota bacterium]